MMSDFKPYEHFATDAIHAGQSPSQWASRAVIPPISLSTIYEQNGPEGTNPLGYEYTRNGNPTRTVAEKCVAALEKAEHGLLFSSGQAVTACITQLLCAGDHVVAMNETYSGTQKIFKNLTNTNGIYTTFVDATDAEKVREAIQDNTRLVWIETPTNPGLKIVDIKAVAHIVRKQSNIILAVDNTVASCYFQRPLDLGAHIAFQSASKYLNGHSDVVMGAIATNDDVIAEKLRYLQSSLGSIPSSFDCYLLSRGIKTLHVRMKQHQENAIAVAKYLESNKRIERVLHPLLPSHPQHERAVSQMIGHSGMVTFYIKSAGIDESKAFLKSLKLVTLAVSLGSCESLAEHPASMTHAGVIREERELLGIHDNMIRLSCGLEDAEDLIQDLEQALVKALP